MATISGGDKLSAALAQIAAKLAKPATLRVGFLEGSNYPEENGQSGDVTAAQAAFWLNYGTKSAPARPFFTDMIAAKSPGWPAALTKILTQNGFDIDAALALMGEGISDQLQQAIISLDSPKLSDVTLMIRQMLIDDPNLIISGKTVGEAAARVKAGESFAGASTKVGVRTKHMFKSVDYEVNS